MKSLILTCLLTAAQINFPASDNTDWKPYEDYRCITDTASEQYELLQSAVVRHDGLLEVDGYIAVALGEAWGEVGDKLVFTLNANGSEHEVKVIIADRKQRQHTRDGWHGHNGHTIEAVVDTYSLPKEARMKGSVDAIALMDGQIVKARKEVEVEGL